jgi:TRAP-type mannitol/chloroaromatic compound transport system substrate-binding protein
MLPAGQIYEALQRNVIDAAEFSIPSMDQTLAFHEIAKYLLVPGIHQPSTILDVMISKRSWQALPDDLKEIVKGAAQITTLRMLTNSIHKDAQAYDFFKAQGITINYLDESIQKELYATALKLMEQKASKDEFIAKVWESQKQFRKNYDNYRGLSTLKYE